MADERDDQDRDDRDRRRGSGAGEPDQHRVEGRDVWVARDEHGVTALAADADAARPLEASGRDGDAAETGSDDSGS